MFCDAVFTLQTECFGCVFISDIIKQVFCFQKNFFQISCCWQCSSAGGVMPWQPFRRKNKYRHVGERGAEEETSFDTELLPRSVSDGNLVRCGANTGQEEKGTV